MRAPIVAAIYATRVDDSMLANPKYTGYQVFGRRRKGKPTPPGKWYWSEKPTHPAIVDRDTWEAAQRIGAEHRSARDTGRTSPDTFRSYALRSRVRCKVCTCRMCGNTKMKPDNKTPTEHLYYQCGYNPKTPSHVAAAPGHPRTVRVREDLLINEVLAGLSAYALAPGREQRLAQLIPSTAGTRQQQRDRQAAALRTRLKRITAQQDHIMTEISGSFDMPDEAGEEHRRRHRHRHRHDYGALHTERKNIETQLTELTADTTPAPAPDLVSLLLEITADLADLPPDLQAELLTAFDIQIIWNAPMRQATFHATITDIITALFTRASNEPAHIAKVWPPSAPASTRTTNPAVVGSLRICMLRKTNADHGTPDALRSGRPRPRARTRRPGGAPGSAGSRVPAP